MKRTSRESLSEGMPNAGDPVFVFDSVLDNRQSRKLDARSNSPYLILERTAYTFTSFVHLILKGLLLAIEDCSKERI